MNDVLLILFWIVLGIIVNAHILFPIVISTAALFIPRYRKDPSYKPGISVIIAAFNEEKVIGQRIENLAAQDYDQSKVEILIGSDASDDRTNEILTEYASRIPNLKIFLFKERRGKSSQLNDLVKSASNPILVFSDANTEFEPNALSKLAEPFCDPKVGGVCGRLVLLNDEKLSSAGLEESLYWKVETFLKMAEGKAGVVIGASGGIYAVRRELFSPVPLDPPAGDDIFISLEALRKGFKVIYEPEAVGKEAVGKDPMAEYRRKVRISALGFSLMFYFPSLLFNKNLLISYSFWSHKITRWFLSQLRILLFILSAALSASSNYILGFFLLQSVFYLFALLGWLMFKLDKKFVLFSIPFYFVMTNVAFFNGFIRFIRKKRLVIWQSTERVS